MSNEEKGRQPSEVNEGPASAYIALELEKLSMDDARLIKRASAILLNNDAAADTLRLLMIAGTTDTWAGSSSGKETSPQRPDLPNLDEFRASIHTDCSLTDALLADREESRY